MPTSRSPERNRVACVIRTRRHELRISQEAMARRVGLTLAGYRPYEYGVRILTPEQLPTWADALEVTRAELAHRLGLSEVALDVLYGAEIAELLSRVTDPAKRDELMAAYRLMARVAATPDRPT